MVRCNWETLWFTNWVIIYTQSQIKSLLGFSCHGKAWVCLVIFVTTRWQQTHLNFSLGSSKCWKVRSGPEQWNCLSAIGYHLLTLIFYVFFLPVTDAMPFAFFSLMLLFLSGKSCLILVIGFCLPPTCEVNPETLVVKHSHYEYLFLNYAQEQEGERRSGRKREKERAE